VRFAIQPARAADYESILALNEAALPHVNSIGMLELGALAAHSFAFDLVWSDQTIAGFILALSEGSDYRSPNYRWFAKRYPRFVYVDRIVIANAFARQGIGRLLYSRLQKLASEVAPVLACEVNLRPANPASLTFHEGLGFNQVGQQETGDGEKQVSLMIKSLK
jgi:uncharacterized protein